MNVNVRLFGPYADAAGERTLRLDVVSGDAPSAADVLDALAAHRPALRPLLHGARLAVNNRFAQPGDPVRETDELAVIGMVGGG